MRGWTTMTLVVIGLGFLILLVVIWIDHGGRAVVANNALDAAALESEIRTALPVGSPRTAVEDFLRKRRIEFGFEPSSESVYAVARNLRGSTNVASKALQLHFSLDSAARLKSIDAKVLYTGP